MPGATPRNNVGRPVEGDDFYGREAEQARMWRDLETDNLLLLAPRRVGKTSLMKRLERDAELHAFRSVYLTVADVKDESSFVRRLYEAALRGPDEATLWRKIQDSAAGRWVKALRPTSVTAGPLGVEFDAAADGRWEELGDALARALQGGDRRWLLLLDELPVFVLSLLDDPPRARHFLNWFRALRQQTTHVRWLLAGSVGLDTVAALHNLADTINDLEIAELGAFRPDEARNFLAALDRTHQLGLDEAAQDRVIERVGWPIPYFLQLVYKQLRNEADAGDGRVDAAGVDRAYARLLDPTHRVQFDYWRQRLTEQLGRVRAGHAHQLLSAVAAGPEGATPATLSQVLGSAVPDPEERAAALEFTLGVLRRDGYLVPVGGRWMYRAPLLRDWWRRFHVG
jgi:hypothetical protein